MDGSYRRIVGAAVVVIAWSALLTAAEKSPLLISLERELVGKEFRTKVVIGSLAVVEGKGLLSDRPGMFEITIDTEVYPEGRVQYLALKNRALVGVNEYVAESGLSAGISEGRAVRISKVELKKDRLELSLLSSDVSYAKLKLMFANRYSSRSSSEELLAFLSGFLVIERFERAETLASAYDSLQSEVAGLTKRLQAAGRAGERLADTERLAEAYARMVRNREEYQSTTGSTQTATIAALNEERRRVVDKIDALKEEDRKERVALLQGELSNAVTADTVRLAELRRAIAVEDASAPARGLVAQCDASLARRAELRRQLEPLGAPASPDTAALEESQRADLQKLAATLNRREGQAILKKLDEQYLAMARRLPALEEDYVRSRGSSQESWPRDRLAALLQQIVANRREAIERGSQHARRQLAAAEKELKLVSPGK